MKIVNHQQSVSPKFGENFDQIDWQRGDDSVKDTPLDRRTSTKRVYRYGPSSRHDGGPHEIAIIPPAAPHLCE